MKEKTKEMIGKNLRTKRKEHGFTQEKLAEKAGVNVRSIQRIEQGMEQEKRIELLRQTAINQLNTIAGLETPLTGIHDVLIE